MSYGAMHLTGGMVDAMPRPKTASELNHVIAVLCSQYVMNQGLNYENIMRVMGALDEASREFHRRVVAPYHDQERAKRNGNNDIHQYAWITEHMAEMKK